MFVLVRIKYNIAMITSMITQTGLSEHLSISTQPATHSRHLRSTGITQALLNVPETKSAPTYIAVEIIVTALKMRNIYWQTWQ